ncbi:hypothetical protein [Streptomyces collinus]|uniref:hypothetical protein n=1 Tax=Streptomyces collinus TaxID=42684 RepID=UPI0036E4F4F0
MTIKSYRLPQIADAVYHIPGVQESVLLEQNDTLNVQRWGAGAVTMGNNGAQLDHAEVRPWSLMTTPAPVVNSGVTMPVNKTWTLTADAIDYVRITADLNDQDFGPNDPLCTGTWFGEPPQIKDLAAIPNAWHGIAGTQFNGDASCRVDYDIQVTGINPNEDGRWGQAG